MKIAVLGSGGREHAICYYLKNSNETLKIYAVPGNAGTYKIAKNINIDLGDFQTLLKFLKKLNINTVIVGPEEPLVLGLTNFLKKNNIRVFGPNKFAAKLEGSKAFMKSVCKKNNIPTADYKVCKNFKDVKFFLKKNKLPIVVKADGLAAGKGVTICKNFNQLKKQTEKIFKGVFRTSKTAVLEEFIEGEELSYFIIADKDNYKFFGSAQDHKRVGEKDKGPNTGGMGAYSPAPILNQILEEKIKKKIIEPTLKSLKKNKEPFTGFLYAGLMIKKNEPYLIEYNVRMGDPECQVILPRLKTDLLKIIDYTISNKLNKLNIEFKNKKSMTVVLCSKGYPGIIKKNLEIKNLDSIKLKNILLFHAGTKIKNNKVLSNGGRVLNVTSFGNNFKKIRNTIFLALKKINWKQGFFRKDIGWRVIK